MQILLPFQNQINCGYPNDEIMNLETALIGCARSHNNGEMQMRDAMTKAKILLEAGASVATSGFLGMSPLGQVVGLEMVFLGWNIGRTLPSTKPMTSVALRWQLVLTKVT